MARVRRLLVLVLHGFAIWALLAATLAVAARMLPLGTALVAHALAAPFLAAVVMAVYHGAFHAATPLRAALVVTAVVALLDVAAERWLALFTSSFEEALERWVPWALVFAQSLASGVVARRQERTGGEGRDPGTGAPGAP